MRSIRIIVGSKSPLKIEAVKAAAAALGLKAEVIGVEADSRVVPQPFGLMETQNGALSRALAAHDIDREAYAIGIENGLVPECETTYDIACVDILTPSLDLFRVRSRGVPVPVELVRASWVSGQAKTAGALEAERSGSDPADPHRIWSAGKTDRKAILTDAVREALLAATRTEGAVS